jgi:hypothetical protein
MNPEGPYVSVAAICESVLHEKDERITCVRFLDILNLTIASDDEDSVVRVKLNAFIAFKSGPFIGTKDCSIQLVGPSGKPGKISEEAPKSFPMKFGGDEQGFNLILGFDLPFRESGLYWFNVMLDEEMYTRIPLRVNITRLPSKPEN